MKFLYDLIFPSFCLHCDEPTDQKLFCLHCLNHLHYLSPKHRCTFCFSTLLSSTGKCLKCHFSDPLYEKVILFERNEMTKTILQLLQKDHLGIYCLVASLFVIRIFQFDGDPGEVLTLSKCQICKTLVEEINRILKKSKRSMNEVILIQEGNHSYEEIDLEQLANRREKIRLFTFMESED